MSSKKFAIIFIIQQQLPVHVENAARSTVSNLLPSKKSTCFNDTQPSKANEPIVFILVGIVIFIRELHKDGQYLERELAKHNVFIRAKTEDPSWSQRGLGILDFINNWSEPVESFVIIDDESFDFKKVGIKDKHVKTSFADGLLTRHVAQAINILNQYNNKDNN